MEQYFEFVTLNEENVNRLFNEVLAAKTAEHPRSYFLYKDRYDLDDHYLFFDTKKIAFHRHTIKYMIGQLLNEHIGRTSFSFKEAILTYQKTMWTKDTATLMKFIYLGIVSNSISPIDSKTKEIYLSPSITPTLSPDDSNFKQWLITDGKEWKEELGQEPSED